MKKALLTFLLTYILIFTPSVFSSSNGFDEVNRQQHIQGSGQKNITVPSPKHQELLDNFTLPGSENGQDGFFGRTGLIINSLLFYLGF